jgi:hypothetical protein
MGVIVEKTDVFDTEDLRRRAYAGYFRSADAIPLDGESRSEVVRIDDKVYVCLSSQSAITGPRPVKYPHIAAIFRVDSFDGQLRRLRRYPPELIERYES